MIWNLKLRSSQDENLKRVFSEWTTEQRLVNVLFDEVHLKAHYVGTYTWVCW